MFGVIFFWTPPHFWALAMRYRDDYAAAGVPMLPVVATPAQVSRRIVVYSWVMAAWTLLLLPVDLLGVRGGRGARRGLVRAAGAPAARRRWRPGREVAPMRLFHLSNAYLCVLFAAIAVDAALGLPVLGIAL